MKNKSIASAIIEKQFWIIIILIISLVVSNGLWIWYINQYEVVTEVVEQEVSDIDASTINQIGIDE